jgi:hypothetical protein
MFHSSQDAKFFAEMRRREEARGEEGEDRVNIVLHERFHTRGILTGAGNISDTV